MESEVSVFLKVLGPIKLFRLAGFKNRLWTRKREKDTREEGKDLLGNGDRELGVW